MAALGARADEKNVTGKLWALVRGGILPCQQLKAAEKYGVRVIDELRLARELAEKMASRRRGAIGGGRRPKRRPLSTTEGNGNDEEEATP